MWKCWLLSVFIVFFSCVQLYTITYGEGNDTLVLLHVILRHGDRTPDSWNTFPNDQYKNQTYYPVGHGQLTNEGKRRMYQLGEYMRTRYNRFLGEYTNDAVYARATNFRRTKATLEVLLAALYAPAESLRFRADVMWQPIPYEYDTPDNDMISLPYLHCVNFLKHYYNHLLSEKGQKSLQSFRDMYSDLSYHTGMSVTSPKEVAIIYAVLKGQDDWGLALPEWSKPYWEKAFHLAAAADYEISTVTPALVRLSAGRLLRRILEDSKIKVKNGLPKHRKVNLYCGHEFNIGTMMRALKVYHRHFPSYGAALFLEIHRYKGGHGLKILYRDGLSTDPKELIIPGCSTICPLEQVDSMLSHHIATDDDICSESKEL